MDSPVKQPAISFDHTVCNNLPAAQQREWLVTNGLGGYAMGTVAGLRTRSYHGLLIAALDPPLGRTLLLANLEETVTFGSEAYQLFCNSWHPGETNPEGYKYIESFRLEGTTPVWMYSVGTIRIEKRLWMQPGVNATYVRYTVLKADRPVGLDIKVIANYRDHHNINIENAELQVQAEPVPHGLRITGTEAPVAFYVLSQAASVQSEHHWHENLYLAEEAKRGLPALAADLFAGMLHATLRQGESLNIVASTDMHAALDGGEAHHERTQYEQELINHSPLAHTPASIQQLALAADQFIVGRGLATKVQGRSVIAGYPWFGDWGRDTMISLPGLTLETGRPELAAQILRTFARFVDKGMLPNRFPDAGQVPEYNTVDATLWYFQAIRTYYERTKDVELLRELFPVLEDVIVWHVRGTRHNIHVDPADQLLYAGEPGTQLTWMDAKYNGWVVTPRIGKPVEINALWYNALEAMANFARELGGDKAAQYEDHATRVRNSFGRFWNEAAGCCYDVLDGPDGHEALLRPNQLFAVSLPHSPLTNSQQKAVVDVCERSLLTPYGLRSLAPDQPGYIGRYEGNNEQRDGAYHQGTVWAWLIGPFVEAHLRVYGDAQRAKVFLEPLLQEHLQDFGLGSASEVFDGDAPFTAHGCPEQAWSVAELLRAWRLAEHTI